MKRETVTPLDMRRLFGCSFDLRHPDQRERFNLRHEEAMEKFEKRQARDVEILPYPFRRQA